MTDEDKKVGVVRTKAGRPPMSPALKKTAISLKLPKWLIDWLDQQPASRPVTIEDALKKVHGLKSPKEPPVLPEWMTKWLDEQGEDRGAAIEAALKKVRKPKPKTPEDKT